MRTSRVDDNQHLNRLLENKTLGELFTGESLQSYTRMQQTHVPPPEAPPVAVEHLPVPKTHRVNFIIHGTADYGPQAYRGPSEEQVQAYLVDAIQNVHGGPRWWLPEVYFEVARTWDYTGGNDEQDTNEHRGAAGADPVVERNIERIINAIAGIQEQQENITIHLNSLERQLADERAARALEAAVRQHVGPAGTDPTVHDRDSQAVSTGAQPGDRGNQRRGRGKLGRQSGPTAAAGDGGQPVDVDSVVLTGPADPGEVRSDDPAGATPVVAPGYIPVNPHTGEEL